MKNRGQKYKIIKDYVDTKELSLQLGLQLGSNFDSVIKKAVATIEELGYSVDCLLLPFLIEKNAKNLLDLSEKRQMNAIIVKMSDEELWNWLSASVLIILRSEVFEPLKTDEDWEKVERSRK